ncbi:acyl carrier protein [Paraburkholderia humisilvae]|uniref:acyl carrier protein n=1 Tax=Paraburkholderia humisilvae TaxID=627669 RepID=UPI001583998C|nr:acyl carrier protein [Paraburkholderia humisilvae]
MGRISQNELGEWVKDTKMLSASIEKAISTWLISQHLTDSFDPRLTFAELGLDSISSTELALFLEKECGVELDETIVYSYPAVDALAQYVAELIAASGKPQSDARRGAAGESAT